MGFKLFEWMLVSIIKFLFKVVFFELVIGGIEIFWIGFLIEIDMFDFVGVIELVYRSVKGIEWIN